eukprot:TRINITY_DN5355_c0_g1_i1.p2 TRINITY_DN5355_c0_g1~~TRINITY_DN5355_c0_g1_i1.p2  ORF type:complete len:154 (+),score=67.50 TRINITY_DN5355_c0_g1_i1:48-464(+)
MGRALVDLIMPLKDLGVAQRFTRSGWHFHKYLKITRVVPLINTPELRRARVYGQVEVAGKAITPERRVRAPVKKMWKNYEDPTPEKIAAAKARYEAKRAAPSIPYVVPKPFLTESLSSATSDNFVRSLKLKLWYNKKV